MEGEGNSLGISHTDGQKKPCISTDIKMDEEEKKRTFH